MKLLYLILIFAPSICVAEEQCLEMIADGTSEITLNVKVKDYEGNPLKDVEIEILEYSGLSSYRGTYIGKTNELGVIQGVFEVPSWTHHSTDCKETSGIETTGYVLLGRKLNHHVHIKKLGEMMKNTAKENESNPFKLDYRFMLLDNNF